SVTASPGAFADGPARTAYPRSAPPVPVRAGAPPRRGVPVPRPAGGEQGGQAPRPSSRHSGPSPPGGGPAPSCPQDRDGEVSVDPACVGRDGEERGVVLAQRRLGEEPDGLADPLDALAVGAGLEDERLVL